MPWAETYHQAVQDKIESREFEWEIRILRSVGATAAAQGKIAEREELLAFRKHAATKSSWKTASAARAREEADRAWSLAAGDSHAARSLLELAYVTHRARATNLIIAVLGPASILLGLWLCLLAFAKVANLLTST